MPTRTELNAERRALYAEYLELVREFNWLRDNPEDVEAHDTFRQKLHAHREKLRAFRQRVEETFSR